MGCDYYIQTELVIEYIDRNGRISCIFTNRELSKKYISREKPGNMFEDDLNIYINKYKSKLEEKLKENTYNKILFDNNEWIKRSYKKKYNDLLVKTFSDISKILKIYKKVTAWEKF